MAGQTSIDQSQNYENPLDKFRSYSYQYILTVASDTEAMRGLMGANQSSKTGASQAPLLQAVQKAKLGDELKVGSGSAWLLIDTRRYSQYSITDLEMHHVYGTGPVNAPNVPYSAHTMKIIDTTGLTFFNFLLDTLRNKVQSSSKSAFFMLAILFTGHRDDGTTETISTCFMIVQFKSINFRFDSSGSTFDIELFEFEAIEPVIPMGVATSQINYSAEHLRSLGNLKSISTQGRSNTVGDMVQALEDSLNQQSLNFYKKFTNEALKSQTNPNNTATNPNSAVKFGKLVQFMINIPTEWMGYKLTTATRSKNLEQVFVSTTPPGKALTPAERAALAEQTQRAVLAKTAATKKAAQANKAVIDAYIANTKGMSPAAIAQEQKKLNAQLAQTSVTDLTDQYQELTFSSITTIDEAINSILRCSKEILDLASSDKLRAGTAIIPKVLTVITSDATTFVLHIDVYPFQPPPNSTFQDGKLTAGAATPVKIDKNNQAQQVAVNVMNYNYLFSGRNTHIKNLEIKYSPIAIAALDTSLNIGGARFRDNAQQAGQVASKQQEVAAGKAKTNIVMTEIRPNDPIFFPIRSVAQKTNNVAQYTEELETLQAVDTLGSLQEFTTTMSELHFLSSLSADMTIRGNPNLIRKFADRSVRNGIPPQLPIISAQNLNNLVQNPTSTLVFENSTVQAGVSSSKAFYRSQFYQPRLDAAQKPATQGQDALLNGVDVAIAPLFVKINIFAPNVDFAGTYDSSSGDPLFTQAFFYNGLYQVMRIQTSFTNGEFEQVLQLKATPWVSTINDTNPSGFPAKFI
jgi:hypothetical protein